MPLKVAYIDDESGMCQIFMDNFASSQIDVMVYTDPGRFLAEACGLQLDLIILDFRFPNITGDQIAKALNTKVPIVLVSGDLSVNLQEGYLRTFTKPFDFDEMQDFLDSFVTKSGVA